MTDNTAYNHYSLLRTIEATFRLPRLAHACDNVVPTMAPLFANPPQELVAPRSAVRVRVVSPV